MAVVIGTLAIDLKANTASFTQSMDKMSQLSAKSANDIKRSLEKVATAGLAMAAAVAGGTTALIKSALDTADDLGKMAQAAGTTTERLSTLGYAGQLSNASMEDLAGGLERLSRAALGAETGNQRLANVFGQVLKVKVTDANGKLKDSGLLFEEIAQRMAKMSDGTGKTALAMELFGRAGATLLPTINSLGSEQEALTEEARRFGLVIGSDTAEAAGRAHDNLDRLHALFKGIGLSLLTATLPAIEKLMRQLINIANHADIPALAQSFGSKVSTGIRTVGDGLQFAAKHANELKIALEAIAALQVAKIAIPVLADLKSGGIEKVGAGIGKLIVSVLGLSRLIGPISQLFGWIKTTTWMIGQLAAEEGIISAATYGFEAALAAIGGPVTLVIAGVVALGVALYKFRDSTFEVAGQTFRLRDAYAALWETIKSGQGLIGFGGKFGVELDKARRERENADRMLHRRFGPELPPGYKPPKPNDGGTNDPNLSGLGPKKDPYGDEIKKLDQLIAEQRAYRAVLGGTPEQIQAVTAAQAAQTSILELNKKLAEEGAGALTAHQEATLKQKFAIAENEKALRAYGDELVNQQHQADLATQQAVALAAANLEGDEAVRQAAIDNALLSAQYGKTAQQIATMHGELTKLRAALSAKSDADLIASANRETNSLQDQVALRKRSTAAISEGEEAVRRAAIAARTFQIDQTIAAAKSDAVVAALVRQRDAIIAAAEAEYAEQDAKEINQLDLETSARRTLAGAILQGEEAYRRATLAVRLAVIDQRIATADNEAAIERLKQLREAVIAQTEAEFAEADARDALRLRSPLQVYNEETAALNRQINQLTANGSKALTYGQSLEVAAAQQDNLNKALEATIDVLLRQGKARDGITAFFLKMQEQAITTARIIFDALQATFDKLSDNLTELITGGKADFAKMFEDIGKQILNSTIRQSLQKGLAGLGEKLGINLGGALGGQRGDSPTNPLYTKDVGAGLVPGIGGGGSGGANGDGEESGGGILGGAFSKIGGFFSDLWSKLSSVFGSVASGAGKVFSFLGGLIPHAEGGALVPNRAYLVGERGPEILTGISGAIMSNAASKRALGAVQTNHYYTIDARGTDPVLTEQRTRAAIIASQQSSVVDAIQLSQERMKRVPQR